MKLGKKFSKKKLSVWILAAIFLVLLSLNILLGNTIQPQPASSGISMTAQFVKLIFAVGVVVVLIYVTLLFLNKFVYHRAPLSTHHQVEILESTPLGPKKSIFLVQVFDRILVLGVTESQISSLTEIADSEIVKSLQSEPNQTVNRRKKHPFHAKLEEFIKRS